MSKLDELIQEYCPDGVDYKELGNITNGINIGINPRNFFKLNPEKADGFYVTVRELNGLKGVKRCEKTDLIDKDAIRVINERANIEIGDVLFSNTGTVGKMALVIEKNRKWGVNEGIYVIKPRKEIITSKYLYYYLDGSEARKDYSSKFTGSTLKHITQKALLSLKIPVPPLPVQEEIVRILDNFTELIAELQAELQARKKQFEYYRALLFTLQNDASKKKLVDVANISRGVRVVKKQLNPNGKYPVYQNSLAPMGYYDKSNCPPGTTYVISAGAAGEIGFCKTYFWAADDCLIFSDLKGLQNRYIYYYLCTIQDYIKSNVRKASIPRLSRTVIENIQIPIIPEKEQDKIVDILDRFDTLCNDLSSGLPAEIEARQKQYEYYRDKLLAFKPLS